MLIIMFNDIERINSVMKKEKSFLFFTSFRLNQTALSNS